MGILPMFKLSLSVVLPFSHYYFFMAKQQDNGARVLNEHTFYVLYTLNGIILNCGCFS